MPHPPSSVAALVARAYGYTGASIPALADFYHAAMPERARAKGWTGQFVEYLLGGHSGNLPEPDFPDLGVELKTIPVNLRGRPLESTYVCTAPLPFRETRWEDSTVRKKLARVLWVPLYQIRGLPEGPVECVGTPCYQVLSAERERVLRADWEGLTECLRMGRLTHDMAYAGEALQLRPKAATARHRVQILGADLAPLWIVPQGFYLRRGWTQGILYETLR